MFASLIEKAVCTKKTPKKTFRPKFTIHVFGLHKIAIHMKT